MVQKDAHQYNEYNLNEHQTQLPIVKDWTKEYFFSCVIIIYTNFKIIATHNDPLFTLYKLTSTNRYTSSIPLTDNITCIVIPNVYLSREKRSQNPRLGRVHINTLHSLRVINEKFLKIDQKGRYIPESQVEVATN